MGGVRRVCFGMFCFGLTVFHAGCGADPDRASGNGPAGPTLLLLDSVWLAETDTLYIGHPFGIVVDPFDGSLYVPDSFSRRIYRFARDGSLLRTYGRPGRGPGELNSVFNLAVVDDSTLAVPSLDPPALYLYDRGSGELAKSVPIPSVLVGTGQAAVEGDAVWFPARALAGNSSFLVWRRNTDSTQIIGALPEEYTRSMEARGIFHLTRGGGVVAHAEGSVLRGWDGLNALERFDLSGRRVERIGLPRVRRRGVPDHAQEWIDQGRRGKLRSYAEMEELHSWTRQMARLGSGLFGLTHHDLHVLEDHGPSRATIFGADVYVSVLSADLESACVDALVPRGGDLQAVTSFHGDTLFVLDRRVVDAGRLQTWVLIYELDTSGCEWLPTTRSPAGQTSSAMTVSNDIVGFIQLRS